MTSLRRLANVILTVIAFLTVGTTSNMSAANATTTTIASDYVTVAQAREATFKQSLHTSHPRYVTMVVTAYTANDEGMNGNAVTALGTIADPFHTVAASDAYPFGTVFQTPDGQRWVVEDRGSAIVGNKLDLYVGRHDTATAMQWGVREIRLQIVKIGRER